MRSVSRASTTPGDWRKSSIGAERSIGTSVEVRFSGDDARDAEVARKMVRIATEFKMQAEARGAGLTRIWVTITPAFEEELE